MATSATAWRRSNGWPTGCRTRCARSRSAPPATATHGWSPPPISRGPAISAAEARGRITFDRFLVSVSLTPTPFYVALVAEARQALDALDGLASLLGRLAGGEAPSFQKLGDALFALQHFAQRVLDERRDRGEEIEIPEEGEDFAMPPDFHAHAQHAGHAGDGEEEGAAFYSGSPVRSRAEAYRRLAEAADYLLRTEPHSPTPYLVRRAVAWGGMSLGELLEELVQTDSDLKAIYTLLGMRERS
jgi:type VI secretion system protein ImpA